MARRVKLWELAWACALYGPMAGYDKTLATFRGQTASEMDPMNETHRVALFRWLNSWGCRQFAKAHHAGVASDSLVHWSEKWLHRLPDSGVPLTDLADSDLDDFSAAFAALQASMASKRLRGGNAYDVTFGPTGAAKTLFALRPEACPPWDEYIRVRLGYAGTTDPYHAYLTDVAAALRSLAAEAEVDVASLPALVGRPGSSPPKLIDEHNWVVVTRGVKPPTRADLATWLDWDERAQGQ